jgi:transposase
MFKILNRIYQKFQKIRKKRKRGSKSRPYSAFRFLAKRGRNVATEANFLSYFTLNQMYRHNLQFGTLLELSYWTSLWFILGLRGRFTVIDLN